MANERDIVLEDIKEIISQLGNAIERLSGKTILITGPSGLLAAYFVDMIAYVNDHKLIKEPAKIIGLTRSEIAPTDRLGYLLGRKDIAFEIHNVIEPYAPKEKIDFIIHVAGNSAPATFQSDPLGTIDVNVQGLRWILEYARNNSVESVLYFSSGEIYGNPPPDQIPTPETFNGNVSPLSPRACYTESKRLCEALCKIYWEKFGVPVKIVRPFIVYGPGLRSDDRRVMADFMRAGIENVAIKMLSEGKDTRSYCYITDASVAFWRILFSDRNAEPFNVASDLEEVSIKELAEVVHKICGIEKAVEYPQEDKEVNFLKEAPQRVRPDITKIRTLFHIEPKIFLEAGLKRNINWNLLRLGKPTIE